MRILALSPHPDDIELGCGGFLAKHRKDDIKVVYFSDCKESLGDLPKLTLIYEALRSVSVLRVNYGLFCYQVRRFSESRQDILEDLARLNADFNPDLVLIPSASDVHQDHKVIHEEAIRAFKFTNTLAYELPRNCRGFNPTHFVALNDKQVAQKIEMIQCYQSQIDLGRNYFGVEQIRANLMFRGNQISTKYAEAFEVITLIEKT
jgi:LmbE family N-acetylglucosaminyl deacetylase